MLKAVLKPDASTGETKLAATVQALGDKKAVGELAGGMSDRWVESQMALGMPHLRLGQRRTRFDLSEVRAQQQVHERGFYRFNQIDLRPGLISVKLLNLVCGQSAVVDA